MTCRYRRSELEAEPMTVQPPPQYSLMAYRIEGAGSMLLAFGLVMLAATGAAVLEFGQVTQVAAISLGISGGIILLGIALFEIGYRWHRRSVRHYQAYTERFSKVTT